MAVKRSRKKAKAKAPLEVYEQAMLAEGGAPVALDLLGFGSTIRDVIRGKPRKAAAKQRATKKARVKTKTARGKKKSTTRKARRKK